MGKSLPLDDLEEIEVDLLLEAIYRRYGYDFRSYARASVKRRIWTAVRGEDLTTVSALMERVLHDPEAMERFLLTISIQVTSMFRDPGLYASLRERVVPLLRTYPSIRIWHAGCSTGEEAYSTAILLEEEGLYQKCKIYATDMSDAVLSRAQAGVVPLARMKEYTANYLQAGGKEAFSDYYTARYDNAIFRPSLRGNLVFAQHNLVTDTSFNEFNLIFCRNVMIYFNRTLQAKVHKLLYDSLEPLGFLAIGSRESTQFTPYHDCYTDVDSRNGLYRKMG